MTSVAVHSSRHMALRAFINVLLFAGILYIFGSQMHGLTDSWTVLRRAHMLALLGGLACTALSFVAAALAYRALSYKRVALRPTLAVQIASGFTNRLLPAGIGSMGLYAAYFRKRGYTLAAASGLVVGNNILGALGNMLLLAAVLAVWPQRELLVKQVHFPSEIMYAVSIMLAICVIFALLLRRFWTGRVAAIFHDIFQTFSGGLRPGRRTIKALCYNMLLTALNALTLCLALAAVGCALSWPAALAVLSFGTLVGAVIPTPGGVGGVEAGMLGGLTAFGVAAPIGLAGVLLYRLLTYWLPILPGFIMFRTIVSRYLS